MENLFFSELFLPDQLLFIFRSTNTYSVSAEVWMQGQLIRFQPYKQARPCMPYVSPGVHPGYICFQSASPSITGVLKLYFPDSLASRVLCLIYILLIKYIHHALVRWKRFVLCQQQYADLSRCEFSQGLTGLCIPLLLSRCKEFVTLAVVSWLVGVIGNFLTSGLRYVMTRAKGRHSATQVPLFGSYL